MGVSGTRASGKTVHPGGELVRIGWYWAAAALMQFRWSRWHWGSAGRASADMVKRWRCLLLFGMCRNAAVRSCIHTFC